MKLLSRATLIRLLIAKSTIEALVVTAVAAGSYLATTNSNLRGWLEQADARTVSGWVVDEQSPGRRLEVQLFIDGNFVEHRIATDFRPDVHRERPAYDDWHGFTFQTPTLAAGEHEARVYVVNPGAPPAGRTLQIVGQPLRFTVDRISSQATSVAKPNGEPK